MCGREIPFGPKHVCHVACNYDYMLSQIYIVPHDLDVPVSA